ncbi:MAG: hypothetical protein LBH01_06740 [Verrucomicrobiales bacterium]|jgi:hypothetical protein|nr:hypothetical protein [Verrucomicrobiales bacterium]
MQSSPSNKEQHTGITWLLMLAAVLFVGFLVLLCGGFVDGESQSTQGRDSLYGRFVDDRTQPTLTKTQWLNKLAQCISPSMVRLNIITCPVRDFKKSIGEPDDIQALGDQSYWLYYCSDGVIQLELETSALSVGLMQGTINYY